MKKLLCVLMFGMVFGQAELTTKIYPFTMSWEANAEEFNFDLQDITGYDLDNAVVSFYKLIDFQIPSDELSFEVKRPNSSDWSIIAEIEMINGVFIDRFSDFNFIYSKSLNYKIRNLIGYQEAGFATIGFAITAEFPQEEPVFVMGGDSQRVIEVTVENGNYTTTLNELFPEYDLEWAIINVVGCSINDQCIIQYTNENNNSVSGLGNYDNQHFYREHMPSDFWAESNKTIVFGAANETFTMKILVTAEFPDDDTGDTDGDGYDDVCYEAGAESVDVGDMNEDGGWNVLDIVALANCVLSANCGD